MSFSIAKSSSWVIAGVLVCLLHCGGGGDDDRASFSADGDAKVMSGLVGTWTTTLPTGETFTMDLCEDTSQLEPYATQAADSCLTVHFVRGDGRGTTETATPPDIDGCANCRRSDNSAYVTGSILGDGLPSTRLSIEFSLTGGDTTGLAFPYEVHGRSDVSGRPVELDGTMRGPDTIDVDDFAYPPPVPSPEDAGESDAGFDAAAPIGPAPADSATPYDVVEPLHAANVVFHRTGDTTCPSP